MGISLKELKKNRLTPAEKWVLGQIEGVEPKKLPNGNVQWLNKDDKWLFTQDFQNEWLNVSFHIIWSVLEKEFGLNEDEIFDLFTNILYDYTNNGKLKIR